jgi:hypothetical protein
LPFREVFGEGDLIRKGKTMILVDGIVSEEKRAKVFTSHLISSFLHIRVTIE